MAYSDLNFESMLFMWLNCCCWLIYAAMLPLPPAVPVNAVGMALTTVYLYIWFGRATGTPRSAAGRKVWLSALFLLACFGMGLWNVGILGTTVMLVNISMFGAPLLQLRTVLRERSSKAIALPTCVVGGICSCLWASIGLHFHNRPMFLPNAIGIVLNAVQVFLCLVFPRKRKA